MPYFARIKQTGALNYRDVLGSIGVLDSLDNRVPVGEAHWKTWDENGLAVWVLRVRGHPIEGRWVIVDREFTPVAS
jgi:hypothetical protein